MTDGKKIQLRMIVNITGISSENVIFFNDNKI
jgi:hypothetical protein